MAVKAPPDWRQTTIREAVAFFGSGDPFLKLEYSASGIPVLAKGDVKPFGRVEHGAKRFVSESLVAARRYRTTQPGDYLLTTRDLTQAADFLGLLAPIPCDQVYLVNQGANVVRFHAEVDGRYLVYWCNGPVYRAYIKGHHVGSTQIHIRKEDFLDAPLWLPKQDEQRAIAYILSTLDHKIETNRRMNDTLEATVRALFKSWFIDFDPIRAKVEGRDPGLPQPIADLFPERFEDSELGEIPAGWNAGTLGDVAEHPRRGIQPAEIRPATPYIALEHMPSRCIALSEWGAADGLESGKFEFRRGEILFGKLRPYFHKVGVAPLDGVCSTDIVVIRAKDGKWFGFVLGHASSVTFVEYTNAGSTGTKMPRTSWGEIARYPVAIPPEEVADAFTAEIWPTVDRIIASVHECRALTALRDALLPKLISGEIRVPEPARLAKEAA